MPKRSSFKNRFSFYLLAIGSPTHPIDPAIFARWLTNSEVGFGDRLPGVVRDGPGRLLRFERDRLDWTEDLIDQPVVACPCGVEVEVGALGVADDLSQGLS